MTDLRITIGPAFQAAGAPTGGWSLPRGGAQRQNAFSRHIISTVLFILVLFQGCTSSHRGAIIKLKDPSPEARMTATEELGRTRDPRWMPYLLAMLQDPNPEVVQSAVFALEKIGHKDAVEPIIHLLNNQDPGIRYISEKALFHFDQKSVLPLLASLKSSDAQVQEASVRLLGKIGDRLATVPLLAALHAPFPDRVRIAAVAALGDLGDERALGPLMDLLHEKDSPAFHEIPDALAKLGSPAVDPLIRALGDPDEEVVRMGMVALGKIGDARALGPLIEKLDDADFFQRKAAVDAIVSMGTAAVLPLMEKAATSYGTDRPAAVDALIRIGDEAVLLLIAGTESDPVRFQEVAMEVLPAIGAPAVKPLMEVLKNESSPIQDLSIEILGDVGTPAVPFLTKGLKTGEVPVRVRCAEALGKTRDEGGVAALMEALASDEAAVREASGKALTQVGTPALALLIQSMMNPESPTANEAGEILVKIGAPAVEPLIGRLNQIREGAPENPGGILRQIGSPAVSGLIDHLSDPELVIQNRCADILTQIGLPSVFPLVEIVERQDPQRLWRAVKILSEIKDPTTVGVGALMGVVRHRDPVVRYFAVQALGKSKDPAAITLLADALADRQVGRRAAEALTALGWRPETPIEKIYYDLAMRNGGEYSPEKTAVKKILLSDLRRDDSLKMEFAVHTLVELFQESISAEMIRTLKTGGSQEMARLFIESGVEALQEAGEDWMALNAPEAFNEIIWSGLFR